LRLKPGDLIKVIKKQDSEFYKGELDGMIGIFPRSHVVPTTEVPREIPAPASRKSAEEVKPKSDNFKLKISGKRKNCRKRTVSTKKTR
jgi:hypothetical protein